MIFRIAKRSDAKQIAKLHYSVRNSHSMGYFSQMKLPFLQQYYNIILDNPYSVVICAENDKGIILGFCSASIKYDSEIDSLKRHWFRLGLAAISSFLFNPKLILETIKRFKSAKAKSEDFITKECARGEYWVWNSKEEDSKMSIIMDEKHLSILQVLGVKDLFLEVDVENKNVYNFVKLNGAILDRKIILADRRERHVLHYDLTKKRRFSFNK